MGRNCRLLQGKYTSQQARKAIRKAVLQGEALEVTLLNYKKDGTPFANSFLMLPLHRTPERDEVTHFIGLQRDLRVGQDGNVKFWAKNVQTHHILLDTTAPVESVQKAGYGEQLELLLKPGWLIFVLFVLFVFTSTKKKI